MRDDKRAHGKSFHALSKRRNEVRTRERYSIRTMRFHHIGYRNALPVKTAESTKKVGLQRSELAGKALNSKNNTSPYQVR